MLFELSLLLYNNYPLSCLDSIPDNFDRQFATYFLMGHKVRDSLEVGLFMKKSLNEFSDEDSFIAKYCNLSFYLSTSKILKPYDLVNIH